MSIKIMTRVWEQSPQKGGALLTLLALADWSNDYGVCWYGGKRLYKKTRLSERNVQYITSALNKTRDLYVCYECSELSTNSYLVITGMPIEEIAESLQQLPFNLDEQSAQKLAKLLDSRPVQQIKVGVQKLHRVQNATKQSEKIAPNTSLKRIRQTPRKRDLFFDALARDFFGCNLEDSSAVKLVAKRVAKIKKELLAADDNLTADDLVALAKWLRQTRPGLSMPQHEQGIGAALVEYRNRPGSYTNGATPAYTVDPTNPEDEWIR